jgi:hypothetical protein
MYILGILNKVQNSLYFSIFIEFLLIQHSFGDLSDDFVYVKDINSRIIAHLRYFTDENFIGRQLIGYEANAVSIKVSSMRNRDLHNGNGPGLSIQ